MRGSAGKQVDLLLVVQLLAHALDHPVAGTARSARPGELPLVVRLHTDLGDRVLRDRPGARSFSEREERRLLAPARRDRAPFTNMCSLVSQETHQTRRLLIYGGSA